MSAKRPYIILVRVGPQRRWATRPTIVQSYEVLNRLRQIASAIVEAGLPEPRVATFFGKPTQDLLVETADPVAALAVLRNILRAYDVRMRVLGRRSNLFSVFGMWRYL